jgi:YbgC/YbaW family acyl-CoA thioester hydrolase
MAAAFQYHHRVTYAECTVGNHIYYGRYLDLLEAARGEFWRSLGKSFLDWQTEGVIFPVLEARLRYHAPARYDDPLIIAVTVRRAERVRLDFAYVITHADSRRIAEAETFHVCAGLNDKPRRLPEELRARLQPWLTAVASSTNV